MAEEQGPPEGLWIVERRVTDKGDGEWHYYAWDHTSTWIEDNYTDPPPPAGTEYRSVKLLRSTPAREAAEETAKDYEDAITSIRHLEARVIEERERAEEMKRALNDGAMEFFEAWGGRAAHLGRSLHRYRVSPPEMKVDDPTLDNIRDFLAALAKASEGSTE